MKHLFSFLALAFPVLVFSSTASAANNCRCEPGSCGSRSCSVMVNSHTGEEMGIYYGPACSIALYTTAPFKAECKATQDCSAGLIQAKQEEEKKLHDEFLPLLRLYVEDECATAYRLCGELEDKLEAIDSKRAQLQNYIKRCEAISKSK